MQENVEFCPKSTFRKSRKVNFAKSSMYLCNLRSNMCNSSFHSGLNPSFATLFSTSARTIVASSLQKEGPFGSNNRLKPCCNLGLNGVSNRVANPVSNPLQTKKHRDLLSVFANLGWNRGSHKVERAVRSYIESFSAMSNIPF